MSEKVVVPVVKLNLFSVKFLLMHFIAVPLLSILWLEHFCCFPHLVGNIIPVEPVCNRMWFHISQLLKLALAIHESVLLILLVNSFWCTSTPLPSSYGCSALGWQQVLLFSSFLNFTKFVSTFCWQHLFLCDARFKWNARFRRICKNAFKKPSNSFRVKILPKNLPWDFYFGNGFMTRGEEGSSPWVGSPSSDS